MVEDSRPYVPERGDLVKMSFDPQAGHELAGWRPAVVVSPGTYNAASSLAVFCPVTSRHKGYPFEVPLPEGAPVRGVILADQLRSLDWRARKAAFVAKLPRRIVEEMLRKISPLVA